MKEQKEHIVLDRERSEVLRQLGFNKPCLVYYDEYVHREIMVKSPEGIRNEAFTNVLGLPAYQQVIDWLREEQGIFVHIVWTGRTYDWFLMSTRADAVLASSINDCREYYEALHEVIDTALEVVIKGEMLTDTKHQTK